MYQINQKKKQKTKEYEEGNNESARALALLRFCGSLLIFMSSLPVELRPYLIDAVLLFRSGHRGLWRALRRFDSSAARSR